MKKLLFLTAAIGFAFSLNAQQTQVREQAPVSTQMQSIEKMDAQLLTKPATILNANTQKILKSTDANYTYLGMIDNAYFSRVEIGGTGASVGYAFALFPDSLAFSTYNFVDDASYNRKINTTIAATGFVFDPYSTSFSTYGTSGLFAGEDTLYGYKVDTISFFQDYRLPNGFNSSSPDTLRFYACTHDVYYPQANTGQYVRLYFPNIDNRNALAPTVNYTNPIPQKGSAVTPKAFPSNGVTWDYILTDADSAADVDPGYVTGRRINTEIGGFGSGGIEVERGSVLSVIVKYIPGFDYNLNDTVSIMYRNYSAETITGEDIKMNRFMIRHWDFETVDDATPLFDLQGYNSFLTEDYDVRYAMDTTDFGNGAYYSPGYFRKPVFYMNLYLNEDNPYIIPPTGITEPSELISGIYPNPATSQLTIDLKEEGNANVAIYNVLGQALIQENVYDMSNTINISNLSQGIYIVKVTQNGKTHTVKFSKQ